MRSYALLQRYHVYNNAQHSSKAEERSAPLRVERLATMLDRSDQVLVAPAKELQHVVPIALLLAQAPKVLELGDEFRAADVRLVADGILPWVHACTACCVLVPLARVVANAKLQRVVNRKARAEHDAQVRGDHVAAVLFGLGQAAHPLVGAAAYLDRKAVKGCEDPLWEELSAIVVPQTQLPVQKVDVGRNGIDGWLNLWCVSTS
jgi:hypothetical protein